MGQLFCGWDWGSTHGACVIDDQGTVLRRWLVDHEDAALTDVLSELADLGGRSGMPVAIERGEGLVVGLIAGAGHPVVVVDPAGFKAARPRWGSSGAGAIGVAPGGGGARCREVEEEAQVTTPCPARRALGP
jgi:hypothetical protein